MNRLFFRNGSRASVLGLAVFAVLLHLLAGHAYSSQQVASLTEFSGTVIIQSRGDWGAKPEKGLPLYSMDKVVTRTGTAVVTFNDGAVMEIRANSNLLIEEQEKTGTIVRNIRLLLGKVLFKTGKGSSTKTNLQTPTAVAGLRGTAGTLSIGADGVSYIQFTEGGTSYTVGDFISGVAKDVPAELADLNPAQRAAFVAAAAADQAKNAAQAAQDGTISDPQAALAAAKAAEAAALEAKAAAESMLNNPDPAVRQQAQAALDAANKAIQDAKDAQQKAIEQGAKPTGPETYTPVENTGGPLFDVPPLPSKPPEPYIPPTTTPTSPEESTTTTYSLSTTATSTTTAPAPTTTIAGGSGSMDPNTGFLSGGGELSVSSADGTVTVKGAIKEGFNPSYSGPVSGNLGDGSGFQGYVSGAQGSFHGFFDSIFVTPEGDAGFLHSGLLGSIDESRYLSAAGALTKTETYGKVVISDGQTLSSIMNDESTDANLYLNEVRLPRLSGIGVDESGRVFWEMIPNSDMVETKGIKLDNDRILGVWRYGLSAEELSYGFSPTTTWTSTFGYEGSTEWTGMQFILGDLTGTDDRQGHLSVFGDLDYLDEHYMGKMTQGFEGSYGEGANAVGSGTMNLVPLAFSGHAWGSLKYYDGYQSLVEGAHADGLLGGTAHTLFSGAPTQILMMGSLDASPPDRPMLLYGSGWYFEGGSTEGGSTDNTGKFKGYTVGIWRDGEIDAEILALYVKDGKAGIISGNPKGKYYDELGLWKIAGELTATEKGETTVSPADLSNYIVNDEFYGVYGRTGSGGFSNLEGTGGSISVYAAAGDPIRIPDQSWGIWNAGFGGQYEGPSSNDWKVDMGGYYTLGVGEGYGGYAEDYGYWIGHITGTEWGDSDIRGLFSGKALTERYLITFDQGKVLGSHWTGDGGFWQAAGIGTYTKEALAWSGYWGNDSLYYNDGGYFGWAGEDYGLIGGIELPWSGGSPKEFLAMGEYYLEESAGAYLWHSQIEGYEISGEGGEGGGFTGVVAGSWKNGDIVGGAASLYYTSDGKAGTLLSRDVLGNFYAFGQDYGMWEIKGTFDPVEMTTDPRRQPDDFDVHTGSLSASLFGRFAGSQGSIFAESNDDSQTMYYTFGPEKKPWGIYNLSLEGRDYEGYGFSGKPSGDPAWSAWVFGTGDFGDDQERTWFALASGTWTDDGVITGSQGRDGMDGFFYDEDHNILGIISGPFFGINSGGEGGEDGYWIGQSVGTWEWGVGSGTIDSEYGGYGRYSGGLYSFNATDELVEIAGGHSGRFGIVSRGENKFHYLALGFYEGEASAPYLQHTRLSGNLEYGDGLFEGFLGSVWKDGVVDGMFTSIMNTSEGGAGILLGDADGGYFLAMWKAKGDLFYVPLVDGLTGELGFEESTLSWAGAGSFTGGGTISVASSIGSTLYIKEFTTGQVQDWGVWQTLQAGTYSGAPSDTWSMSLTHGSETMNHWLEVEGAKWSEGKIAGKAAGAWVNWDKAVTGVMGGQLKGTFNPTDATWQAVAAGAQLETSQFMDMVRNGNLDALQKLNIPCFEVGRADLYGEGNNLKVTIKDMTFLSDRMDGKARLMATDKISGTYSGTPQTGIPFGMTQTGGSNTSNMNASFTVKTWGDTSWGATINGGGNVGTNAVTFSGAGAGSVNTQDNTFKGTGSGTVKSQ